MENTLTITSPAFENDGKIPVEYTGHGADISPELHISALPEGTKSLAVLMDDIDHPIRGYSHWVLWNLPPQQVVPMDIPHGERLADLGGAMQGIGYGRHRYRGPKPPFNWSHRYRFTVYAVDTMLDLPAKSRKRHVKQAMKGHILAKGELWGRYR